MLGFRSLSGSIRHISMPVGGAMHSASPCHLQVVPGCEFDHRHGGCSHGPTHPAARRQLGPTWDRPTYILAHYSRYILHIHNLATFTLTLTLTPTHPAASTCPRPPPAAMDSAPLTRAQEHVRNASTATYAGHLQRAGHEHELAAAAFHDALNGTDNAEVRMLPSSQRHR